MRKEFYWKIVLILVVVVVSVWFAHPIKEKINLGLDLQGGMHLVWMWRLRRLLKAHLIDMS